MSPAAGSSSRADEVAAELDLLVRPTDAVIAADESEKRLLRETGAGSGRIGKDEVTNVHQLRRVIQQAAHRLGARPLLVSVNQEGGRLNALDWPGVAQLPGNLALGAAGDEDLAEQAGCVLGAQLRAAGLTWNLAPVCDLAGWPSSPAVGSRAFGSNPQQVGRLAAGFVRGLQSRNVAATAKHFPGLGAAREDPHHHIAVVDQLDPAALIPFRAAIAAQVACVMVGSHIIRAIDDRPALASPRVLGLLRHDLGFTGVTVSENLAIPAVHEPLGGIEHAAVAAMAAGIDVIMLDSEVSRGRSPHRQRVAGIQRRVHVVQALAAAVARGTLDRERIRAAAARVRALHQRYGLTGMPTRLRWESADAAARLVARRVADRSVTVLRGRDVLPLKVPAGQPLTLVRVPDTGDRRADSARHGPDLLPDALGEYYQVVPVAAGFPVTAAGPVVVYGYDTRTGTSPVSDAAREASRYAAQGRTVVQVAFGDVDDLAGSEAGVLLAAFSPHLASVTAAAAVLAGARQPSGSLPQDGGAW